VRAALVAVALATVAARFPEGARVALTVAVELVFRLALAGLIAVLLAAPTDVGCERRKLGDLALALAAIVFVFGVGSYALPELRARVPGPRERTHATSNLIMLRMGQVFAEQDALVDADGDGVGEFLHLEQLLGFAPLPPGRVARSTWRPDPLDLTPVEGEPGRFTDGWYVYEGWLPDAGGGWSSRPRPGGPRAADADVREVRYRIFAWPLRGPERILVEGLDRGSGECASVAAELAAAHPEVTPGSR
jgi:hypothetical protein